MVIYNENLIKLQNVYETISKYHDLSKDLKNKNINKNYDMDIINQLIEFEMGTKSQIINAMNNVVDKNDINQIVEYLKSKHKNDIKEEEIINIQNDDNNNNDEVIAQLLSIGFDLNIIKL